MLSIQKVMNEIWRQSERAIPYVDYSVHNNLPDTWSTPCQTEKWTLNFMSSLVSRFALSTFFLREWMRGNSVFLHDMFFFWICIIVVIRFEFNESRLKQRLRTFWNKYEKPFEWARLLTHVYTLNWNRRNDKCEIDRYRIHARMKSTTPKMRTGLERHFDLHFKMSKRQCH